MASISSILGNNSSHILNKATYTTQMIHYSQFQNSEMQFYDMGKERVNALADNIELAGSIHEPVIVRKIDAEIYEIISGHKRIAAARTLVEDRGKKEFAFVPARVIQADDYMAEYLLISTNDYPDKTDYERMMEVVRLYEILPHIKADEPLTARMLRKLVSREASICETRVGNYTNIYKNLSPTAMEAFKKQKFGISVAIRLAALPHDEQDRCIKNGKTKLADVTPIKKNNADVMPPEINEAVDVFTPDMVSDVETLESVIETCEQNSGKSESVASPETKSVENETRAESDSALNPANMQSSKQKRYNAMTDLMEKIRERRFEDLTQADIRIIELALMDYAVK